MLTELEQLTFYSSEAYGKRICLPGWHWSGQQPAFHDYDIFYVISGQGEMTLKEEHLDLRRGSCLVLRPGDTPIASQSDNDRLTVIYLHFRLEDRSGKEYLGFTFPRLSIVEDLFETEEILNRTMGLLDFPTPYQAFEFDCLLKLFFIQLSRIHLEPVENQRCSVQQIQKVKQMMTYVREGAGIAMDYVDIAHRVHLSPQYMARLFKTCTGISLKSFITQTKLERAKEMLLQTSMNVSEVADQLGYSDVYTFSKSFKQQFGVSPSHYLASTRPSITIKQKG